MTHDRKRDPSVDAVQLLADARAETTRLRTAQEQAMQYIAKLETLLAYHYRLMTMGGGTDDLFFHANGVRVSLKEQTRAIIAAKKDSLLGAAEQAEIAVIERSRK